MKKVIFGITLILVIGLFLAGCSKSPETPTGEQTIQNNMVPDNAEVEDSTDVYVDEQIIDENQSVEIGEMI